MLKEFYKEKVPLIISTEQINFINQKLKNINSFMSIEDFIKSDSKLEILNIMYSLKHSIEKQIKDKEAIQMGLVTECVYISTFANHLELKNCSIVDNVVLANYSFENKEKARFIYTNNFNKNIYIIQYGDPQSVDAILYKNNESFKLEIKEQLSRSGDADITCYDENGKFFVDKKWLLKYEDMYLSYINDFNLTNSIFDWFGHNYPITNEIAKRNIVNTYFSNKDFVLTSNTTEDNLLVISSEDIVKFIKTDGSEIRTTGKNLKKVWTPLFLQKTLDNLSASVSNNFVKIKKDNVRHIIGRGKDTITRIRIGEAFVVKIENIKEDGEYYFFKYQDIKQTVPNISVHINFFCTYEILKNHYGDDIK